MDYSDSDFLASDLVKLFNQCFETSENTLLVGNGEEPLYQPAGEHSPHHQIVFTLDYFASGLHEIAHWCIAGSERRKLVDYGYWYEPDGRSASQQASFEIVEAKPQALEWILAHCCGYPFRVSADNLNGPAPDLTGFRQNIFLETQRWLEKGLPARAEKLCRVLCDFYRQPYPVAHNFNLKALR
ncbi:elongation factor P hydroxylase [Endozoicomonadaceae bacterium StTr2]